MSVNSAAGIAPPKLPLGIAARLALIAAVFFGEKTILNGYVNFARAEASAGIGAAIRFTVHWGFRLLVAFAASLALFACVRAAHGLKSADAAITVVPLRTRWALAHFACAGCLAPLSYFLYHDGVTSMAFVGIATLWSAFTIAAAASAVLACAPWKLWMNAARALGNIWWYAAAVAALSVAIVHLSQMLWEPTASITFDLVHRLLSPILPSLAADASTRMISTHRFSVQISEVCSGLEGMGLILAFTIAWLTLFRREYRFPSALILIPIGLVVIFSLNVVRIAALVLIGNAGFPDVAIYGFHSQAGWIAFIAASCGLVLFSRRSAAMYRGSFGSAVKSDAEVNSVAPYLMPLVAILAAGVISHAISGQLERFYPLRVIAAVAVLWVYRRRLGSLNWRWSWRGPAIGIAVFLVWIVAAHLLLPSAAMPGQASAISPELRWSWIICRIAGSVITVPVAEELAYRGFLMRRLTVPDWDSLPYRRVSWIALIVSSILFGVGHGSLWLPAIVAGLAYGDLLRRRSSIGEAVAAHATSNALVAAAVLGFDQWQLW